MTQAISLSLARLEPDLRAAADRAAGRAGVALDAWIAAKLRERAGPDAAARPPGQEGGAGIPPMEVKDGPGEREGAVDEEPDDRDDALLRSLKRSLRDLQGRLSRPSAGGSIDGVGRAGDEAGSPEYRERAASPADPGDPDRSCDERHGGRRVENDLAQSVERLSARLEAVAQDHAAMLAQAVRPLIAAARAPIPPNVVAEVAGRLDGIDERLRRAEGSDRLEPIEAKLGALAERLGEAGAPSVAASLASFRQAMDHLSSRVDVLHEGTLEAVDRAVKGAVAEAIGPPPLPSHPDTVLNVVPDGGAQAGAADQGIEDALRAVHRTLEAVASRLATAGGYQDDTSAASGEFDEPVEPGAERSQPFPRALAQAETDDAAVGDIKAGFIAAARRAARNAAGAGLPDGPPAEAGRSGAPFPSPPAGPARVAAARLKFALGRYRGALVLGLAAAALAGEAVPVEPRFAGEGVTSQASDLPGPHPSREWTQAALRPKRTSGFRG